MLSKSLDVTQILYSLYDVCQILYSLYDAVYNIKIYV